MLGEKNQIKILELKNTITKMRSQWISLIASEDRLREFKNREFKKIKHNRKKNLENIEAKIRGIEYM